MAGIFMLGDVLSAIKPPKLSQVKYSDALGQQLDDTTNSLTGYRANQAADLSKYGTALDEATGKVKALEAGDNSVLAQLIASSNQDPMDTYRGVGDYQFGVLDKLSKSIAGQGRAQDNALLAQFGAGGRGGCVRFPSAARSRPPLLSLPGRRPCTGRSYRSWRVGQNRSRSNPACDRHHRRLEHLMLELRIDGE